MAGAASVPTLRDTLAARLATLRNGTELGLTVLVSTPKRTTAIFPHAPSASVKCWDTEYLAVVSADVTGEASTTPVSAAKPTSSDPACSGPTGPSPTTTNTAEPAPPENGTTPACTTSVLAAAISCHVYTLPSPADAPASILYISKVDSSGYASSGPITRVLASGVLAHFLSPRTRPGGARGSVTATLFARAQGQYLFPNSADGGSKRVLGGLGLCQWWKGVYEEAAGLLVNAPSSSLLAGDINLAYVLPSYTADEARGILGAPRRPLPPGVGWTYAPPFNAPLFGKEGRNRSLATLIPSLPDDPKTRFLEELVDSAMDVKDMDKDKEKARATPLDTKRSRSRKELEAAEEEADRRKAYAVLAKIPLDEFWERMGFRQECVSGDVTGFFSAHVGPVSNSVYATEAERQQERVEGEEGEQVKDDQAASTRDADETASIAPTERSTDSTSFAPPRQPHTLPQPLVERILTSLLNTDFGSRALAYAGTSAWLASMRALVVDEVGETGLSAATATIAPKAVSPEATAPKRREEVVTMLQPRKKKRV